MERLQVTEAIGGGGGEHSEGNSLESVGFISIGCFLSQLPGS